MKSLRPWRASISTLCAFLLLLAGCGSSVPTAELHLDPTLPLVDSKVPVLLDCEEADKLLCAKGDWVATTELCEELVEESETQFLGHRCLAHVEIERSKAITSLQQGGGEDDPGAMLEAQDERRKTQEVQHLEAALWHLDAAVEIAPEEYFLHRKRVDVLERLDRPEALEPSLSVLSAHPELRDTLHGIAFHAADRKKYDFALTIFDGLLAQGEDVELLTSATFTAIYGGETKASLERSKKAVELEPNNPQAVHARIHALVYAERFDAAMALAVDMPSRFEPTGNGIVTGALLVYGEAPTEVLERYLANYPDLAELGKRRADLDGTLELAEAFNEQMPEVALVAALFAAKMSPALYAPTLTVANAFKRLEMPKQRIATLERRLKQAVFNDLPPVDASVDQMRLFLANAQIDVGELEGARLTLAEIRERDAVYNYLDGRLKIEEGDREGAMMALQAVLDDPAAGGLTDAAQRLIDQLGQLQKN